MKRVVILGAGGFARETADIYEALIALGEEIDLLGYVVERGYAKPGAVVNGRPILGDETILGKLPPDTLAVAAVGDPGLRRRLVAYAEAAGLRFDVAVHPSATLTPRATIGSGSVVTAGVRVTNNIAIGRHVHLNLNCTVGHDSLIGDFVTVSPGAHISGNVVLGSGVTLGTGAVVLPGVHIGDGSTVGAGAVVTRGVGENQTVVGVPARALSRPG